MKVQVAQEPVVLSNEPCVHGMSNKNWCALCRQASGDKHANTIIKAFTPKTPKKFYVSRKLKTNDVKLRNKH